MIMLSRFTHNLYNTTTSISNVNYVVTTILHCIQLIFCSL
nr:MAG TPA: hypothetical protein [Crassvirales sp.]